MSQENWDEVQILDADEFARFAGLTPGEMMRAEDDDRERRNNIFRFEAIMEEIQILVEEAGSLLPRNSSIEARAMSYWHPTIIGCVNGRATMHTMENTLDELKQL